MFRAHRPFHPGRLPFFYGWVIMVCGIVGQLMSLPGQTIGISVFTDDLIQATGLSRLNLSTAYMFGTALGSFLLPLSGRFYDVAGARTAAMTAGAGLGLSLLYMSQVDFLPRLLAGDSPPTWMNFAFVLIGILMIRFTGQGTLTLISRNVLMEWFEAKRGLVNGVSGVFISLSFSAAPWMFEQFIRGFTWRGAWLILAATVGLLFPVFAWLFFRDKPEDHGLLPDGRRSRETSGTTIGNEDASREDSAQSEAKSYTAAQARRTYEFWVYSLALSVFALYATAMTFHIFSLFAKAGMGRDEAVAIFPAMAIVAVVSNLIGGWLSDRTSLRWFLILFMVGLIVSALSLLYLDRPGATLWLIAGNGLGSGMFGLLSSVVWPRLFGRKHLGAVSGAGLFWNILFSAFGPVLFALAESRTGDYRTAIIACLAAMIIFLGAAFFVKRD